MFVILAVFYFFFLFLTSTVSPSNCVSYLLLLITIALIASLVTHYRLFLSDRSAALANVCIQHVI